MKKLYLLAMLLTIPSVVKAGTLTQKSLEALKKYCIPKPGDEYDGITVCGSEFEGKYNGNKNGNTCGCYDDKNLVWDPELRHCKVKCDMVGTFPRHLEKNETNGKPCPIGFYPSRTISRTNKN